MIKNKIGEVYCEISGCHEKAGGVTTILESRSGARFIVPTCDFHHIKKNRFNAKSDEGELQGLKLLARTLMDRISKLEERFWESSR